jgi:hypothetical protein
MVRHQSSATQNLCLWASRVRYISCVRKDRSQMTVRIVRLGSPEADDVRMAGTVAERLAVVAELTDLGWALAKLPLPTYTRSTMPVVMTTRSAQTNSD